MDEGRFQDITRPIFSLSPHLHLIYNIGVSPVSAILSPRLIELIRWLIKAGGFFAAYFTDACWNIGYIKRGLPLQVPSLSTNLIKLT